MQKKYLAIFIAIAAAAAGLAVAFYPHPDTGRPLAQANTPAVRDNALKVELVAEGLAMPTSMQFLDENNILVLQNGLSDLVSDNPDEISAITFATGFAGVTDIETGPDGNIYVLSFLDGRIYRITTS